MTAEHAIVRAAGMAAICAAFAVPAAAQPANPNASSCRGPAEEARLRERETVLLGAQHAAEHAEMRASQCASERAGTAQANSARPPSQTLAEDQEVIEAARQLAIEEAGGRVSTARAPAKNAAKQARVEGQWSSPFTMPVQGVAAVLLHTRKLLLWSYDPASYKDPDGPNTGVAFLWDPTTRQGRAIAPPENIWCGGQTILADGRVFVAGGNLRYPDPSAPAGQQGWQGSLSTYTFDPATESWTRQPDMQKGRWYPTTTKLGDSRVVITSGFDETGAQTLVRAVELFTPAAGVGTVTGIGTHDFTWFYPLLSTLPSGNVLEAGPHNTSSSQLNPATWTWGPLPAMHDHHYSGNVISYADASVAPARHVVMVAGADTDVGALTANEYLDGMNPGGGWRSYPKWQLGRFNANTVLLPDGSMFTVGGGAGPGNYDNPLMEAELYTRPATDPSGSWQKVAAPGMPAAYHSSAILLPDATVLLSEDDRNTTATHRGQVYSPPYLFKGARPRITSAPARVGYGQSFAIGVDRTGITSAVLIAPGATTHGNDMHQRGVRLQVAVGGTQLTATVPISRGMVPPGYYMLFVLDANGIPSEASFIQVI